MQLDLPLLGKHNPGRDRRQCLCIDHVMDTRHTDWSESAQPHPQKHHVPCKSLWLICLEISEELSCSGKDEQTGTELAIECCRREEEAFSGIQTREHTQNLTHELRGGCPCCDQNTTRKENSEPQKVQGMWLGGWCPHCCHAWAVRDTPAH